ncbi:unnamed protein product [Pedinophyceae sp. YPF-701]|nr:unnamed protein product [Pedinophyceae sp. YPF-701]
MASAPPKAGSGDTAGPSAPANPPSNDDGLSEAPSAPAPPMTGRLDFNSEQTTLWSYLTGTPGSSGFGSSTVVDEVLEGVDLAGRVALVTGCCGGIGSEVARGLARRGCHIVAVSRTLEKAETSAKRIRVLVPDAKVTPLGCDMSSFASVRQLVDRFFATGLHLHILINNAAVMASPFSLTPDGFEEQWQVNYLSHFLLTHLLLPHMRASAAALAAEPSSASSPAGPSSLVRVVNVTCSNHYASYQVGRTSGIRFDQLAGDAAALAYSSWFSFGQSKLAMILHARALTKVLHDQGARDVLVLSANPGIARTGIQRFMGFGAGSVGTRMMAYMADLGARARLMKTPSQAAATVAFAAAHPAVEELPGAYLNDCNLGKCSRAANDPQLASALWTESLRMIGVLPPASDPVNPLNNPPDPPAVSETPATAGDNAEGVELPERAGPLPPAVGGQKQPAGGGGGTQRGSGTVTAAPPGGPDSDFRRPAPQ